MASIIQKRRDTAANFTAANPILAQGEEAYELDTGKEKRGDGVTAWNDLDYLVRGGNTHYHRKVISIVDNTTTPPTEVSGDRYILDETGGGVHADWDGASANDIVEFTDGSWVATTPEEGDKAYVDSQDKDARFVDDGTPQWELIAAGGGGDMLAVNNLSDVDNVATARTNLDVYSKAEVDALTGAQPPVDETYADITALIANQNAQLEDWFYEVTDASAHPDVTSGRAVFTYLGTTLGTIADYQLEWKDETTGTGSSTPASDTGNDVDFTRPITYYNELTALTSGDINVDRDGALKGALSIIDADKYAPDIILSAGDLFYLNGIKPDPTAYNIITLEEKVSHVLASVNKILYLNQPANFVATPQDEALLITFDASENAESYDIYYGITDVFANATLAGNITVLLLLIETLTNGTEYYVWVVAKGKGFKNSIPLITSGTPAPAIVSNTFIEGKGVSITTASALATLLGINEVDINGFNLNGNDIDCEIVVNYSLPVDVFKDDAEITKFRDIAGKVTSASLANVFENADNLTEIEMTADLSQTPDVNGCALLEKLNYPNCTGILTAVRNCPNVYIINGLFDTIGYQGIQGSNALSTIKYTTVTTMSNNTIYEVSSEVYIDLPNVTTIPTKAFYLTNHANSVIRMEGATSIAGTQGFFRVDAKRIYIGNVTSIGDPTTDQSNFQNTNTGAGAGTIYVDPVLMTNNAGGLDADLVTAQTAGATIVSCVDKTAPEAISDLAATAVSSGSCDLSFTVPNTTNALDFYEVWVDKNDDKGWQILRPTDEITASGDTISGVLAGYKIKVYACDIYYNRSLESNEITLV